MVGVTDTRDALQMALDAGLDLVEVSPEADPPVCRILDFGKYRYEQSKKEKSNRAKSKTVEMKEIRLGRSMKIDPHDVGIRLAQARKFLMDGHKVQIVQNFRGREMLHKERGSQRMKEVVTDLADISKVEMAPRMAGRRMTLILSPDKSKVDRIKAALAKAAPAVSQPQAAPQPETAQLQAAPQPEIAQPQAAPQPETAQPPAED